MNCSKCNEDTTMDKNALYCDSCNRAVHKECSGLSSTELRVMELKSKRMLKYLCKDCEEGLKLVPKLFKTMDMLRSDIEILKSQLEKTVQNSIDVKSSYENPEEMYSEISDRIDRSRNVLIYNIPENPSKELEVRINHDESSVSDILNDLEIDAGNFKSIRLGRPSTRPRPVKVIFKDASIALQCLRKRRNLGNESNIRIGADLTIMQRDHIKRVYKELDERKAKGENNIIVKFIRGVPRIVESLKRNEQSVQKPKN